MTPSLRARALCAQRTGQGPGAAAPGLSRSGVCTDLCTDSPVSDPGSAPPMISSASVVATWRCTSRSVCTYCRIVNATSECPIRSLRAFKAPLRSAAGPAPAPASGLGEAPAGARRAAFRTSAKVNPAHGLSGPRPGFCPWGRVLVGPLLAARVSPRRHDHSEWAAHYPGLFARGRPRASRLVVY
jgi:hypothetical protein